MIKGGSAAPAVAVAIGIRRIGPYHAARLKAASGQLRLVALEFTTVDPVYDWDEVATDEAFGRLTLPDSDGPDPAGKATDTRSSVDRALDAISPAAVAVPGWSHPAALAMHLWARRRRRPIVLMSDSNATDRARRPLAEAIKRRLVGGCDAALVGGSSAAAYLTELGMPASRIRLGYDLVDNDHFASGNLRSRAEAMRQRQALGLPERFFLTVARFVAEKNLLRLLDAYARYAGRAGPAAWGLVLLGEGRLRPQLEAARSRLGLDGRVSMPGFKQYDELPRWYGLASALVHPSTAEPWGLVVNEAMAAGLPVLVSRACGCAADLVVEAENGFLFDPLDPAALAVLMHRLAHGGVDRAAMAGASRRIVAGWGLARFGEGLAQALAIASAAPRRDLGLLDRAGLWTLIRSRRSPS